jgi:hypothetical protein
VVSRDDPTPDPTLKNKINDFGKVNEMSLLASIFSKE